MVTKKKKLTFLYNLNILDVIRRLWTEKVKEKGLGRDELIKFFDSFKVFSNPLQNGYGTTSSNEDKQRLPKKKKKKNTKALVSYPLEKLYACKEN